MAKTKQAIIQEQEVEIANLHEENVKLIWDLVEAKELLRQATRIETETGLVAWLAGSSAGTPVCIGGRDEEVPEEQLAVSIYHRNGAIVGVVISNNNAGEIVQMFGHLPVDVVDEEIRMARGERLTV